jgi:flagellar biosynthesis protein FlhG
MKRICAFGGGKGGTGKSFVVASLGALLAKLDKKVLLIDLDLGASNLHTFLAIRSPKTGLDKYLSKQAHNLEDVAVTTSILNLSLISSTRCSLDVANIHYARKLKVMKAILNLDYDYIFLDLGSGTHFNTVDFFLTSNEGFLVTTPGPVSIENMFRFIQTLYLRKLRQIIKKYGAGTIFQEELNAFKDLRITSPHDLVRVFRSYNEKMGKELEDDLASLKFKLIINQFQNQVDPTFGLQLAKVCNRHFYFSYEFMGNVGFDMRIYKAISDNGVFVHKYHYTKTASDLQNIVNKILNDLKKSADFQSSAL